MLRWSAPESLVAGAWPVGLLAEVELVGCMGLTLSRLLRRGLACSKGY